MDDHLVVKMMVEKGLKTLEKRIRVLGPWEEVVGTLDDFHLSDDPFEDEFHVEIGSVGVFEFMSFEKGYLDLLDAIAKIPRGSKIGILRTDDGYKVRSIE